MIYITEDLRRRLLDTLNEALAMGFHCTADPNAVINHQISIQEITQEILAIEVQ